MDYSDHAQFWEEGYPALMVTGTAFMRNPNYHEASDTPDTLDYERIARVVEGLKPVIHAWANP
ncbi:MAG: M28 family peptidase [Myxococcota bacterium]